MSNKSAEVRWTGEKKIPVPVPLFHTYDSSNKPTPLPLGRFVSVHEVFAITDKCYSNMEEGQIVEQDCPLVY